MFSRILLGALCLLMATALSAQSQYYYADGDRVALSPSTTHFVITADENATLQTAKPIGSGDYASWAHKPYATFTATTAMTPARVKAVLGFDTDEVQVSPGYAFPDGFVIYPTRRVVARLADKANAAALDGLLADFTVRSRSEKYGVLRLDLADLDQAFALANRLQESGLVAFAQPDFYAPVTRYQDPLLPEQFQMHNTGQTIDGVPGANDADCNALEAWDITLGSNSITVAVIDDGLEDHEDLNNASGQSRYTAGFSPANSGNGDAVSGSAHGVSCAGSIAASHNNIGVRGVAPLVNLISVNIFVGGESTQDIADGFDWARTNGADIMSNSWGYTSCTANFSNINTAMANANSNGRGGLGTIVIFASGNGYKDCVDYPANNPNVVAVGAFSNQGIRSAYSNYGDDLDIMAPSNNVGGPGAGVRTTDRMGTPGYNGSNYTSSFGGTSSACPVVAGVAALVLGYDPNLSSGQLKNILYSTAIDMGPGGVDAEYANGRVNALGALQAAGAGGGPTCSDGIQNGQETGIDCGGPDCADCPPTSCNGTEVTLSFTFDDYPEETSWTITDAGNQIVASGGTYGGAADGSSLSEVICLSDGCYTLTVFDAFGDGICCAYGNGSYGLTGDGQTLASGASFGASEATEFCVSGSAPDTEAPSVPTGLTVSNVAETTLTLSWNASSDNVGVTGYDIYIDGVLAGSVNGTAASITDLTACTNYTFGVSARDAAGNVSATATTTGSTTGCTTADTEAPSVPTGLVANNVAETTLTLNWNASSDNVGVTAYNVFIDGVLAGSVNGTAANLTDLTACTDYTFGVSAVDAAGNESATATTTATTTGCTGGGGSDLLSGSYFETGFDGWQDGGSDCYRYSGNNSWEGSYSIRIRDNSGVASSMTSSAYDLAGYAAVEVSFYFYANSMENGEDFWLRYNSGSGWQTVATYTRGTDFNNRTFYTATVTLDAGSFALTDGARFRFQCDASGNNDQIYIDEVFITGLNSSGQATVGTGISRYTEAVPGHVRYAGPDQSGDADLRIRPNPATDHLRVEADELIQRVTLYSAQGRQLLTRTVGDSEFTNLRVGHLPTGVYLLSVQTEEETITERVVIKR